MFLSIMDEAINEGTINALTVITVECLDDLTTVRKWQGRSVIVRSVIRNKHLGRWNICIQSK